MNSTLEKKVTDAVVGFINTNKAFTTVDISHPIIHEDPNIRHSDIRKILDHIINNGTLDSANYTSSPITVYPSPSSPKTARLFHPDDPGFDPSSYASVNQELHRPTSQVVTRQYNMTDLNGDDGSNDGVSVLTTTSSGDKISKQCIVQTNRQTISVPRIIVRNAGFSVGDSIKVHKVNGLIRIEKADDGKQRVDGEGRIRLHGENISGKSKWVAVVVDYDLGTYIQIQ